MRTGNIEFKRGVYNITSINKDNTKFDYELQSNIIATQEPLFTEILRLELDNGFHHRSRDFDYWLFFRDDTNWIRCSSTGLAKTEFLNLLEGNIPIELNLQKKTYKGTNFQTEQHLVIVQSKNIFDSITVDIFKDFYIRSKVILKHFIKEHHDLYSITKKEL